MVVLSIGKSSYDITIPMEDFIVENTKTVMKEKLEGGGGAALNVAYLLGKWNCDSYFSGVVGFDDIGSSIKKDLDSNHVHTTFLETNYERKTTTTYILANKKNSSRTQIMVEPEAFHLKKYDYDVNPNVIYSDGYEYSASLAAFNKFSNAVSVLGAGINVADPKEIEALAKYAKYVVFSLDFACKITKMSVDMNESVTLLNLYKELKEKYPHSINIITLHNMGVLYSINNEVKVMPTIEVKELDRTGAGDVFDGAFVYALSKGYDLEKCLRLANIAGALSTTKYGGKSSIPILSDVIHHYENKFGSLDAQVTNNQTTSEEINTEVVKEEPPINSSNEVLQVPVNQPEVVQDANDSKIENNNTSNEVQTLNMLNDTIVTTLNSESTQK